MIKRESGCPLCGAKLTAAELLDACNEIVAPALGALSARCPHCQGYLEVLPTEGRLEIGYTSGSENIRFESASHLLKAGLEVDFTENPPRVIVRLAGRAWEFSE